MDIKRKILLLLKVILIILVSHSTEMTPSTSPAIISLPRVHFITAQTVYCAIIPQRNKQPIPPFGPVYFLL